jgi:hypothetical protein
MTRLGSRRRLRKASKNRICAFNLYSIRTE